MTIIKHLFWGAVYTFIFINCLTMTVQYFAGLNNIVNKMFGLIEDVNLAALF